MAPRGLAPIEILLVEDNAGDVRLIQEMLSETGSVPFVLAVANSLATALERLRVGATDVLLLDLGLPDSTGVGTFAAIHAQIPTLPIIVLTGFGDQSLALRVVQHGAQDYLIKGQVDGNLIWRTIRYAMERQRGSRALLSSDTRLKAIIDAALDAIITVDEEGRITGWSLQAERIFGWPAADALGRTLAETIVPPRYREAHLKAFARFLATQESELVGRRTELTAMRRDGTEFPVELSVACLRLEGRWLFSTFVRDITTRRRAEAEIRQLHEQLEGRVAERTSALAAANRELETFTYSVSHDLRGPLRQIDGFSRILVEHAGHNLDAKSQHYLRRIQEGTQHMGQLVDDLLNLAQLGRLDMRTCATPLDTLVNDALAELRADWGDRTIQWATGGLPRVECDPGLIKIVFTNLLSNAIKYTRPRKVAIIEVAASVDEGRCTILVRDNGVGFNMKYADKLFGVFQRLHRADQFEGTGVGLATVQRIIHKHGGEIWAEAEPDKGATFFFTLARRRGREAAKSA
jgi:PAS domain S-box-containing protein